MLPGMELPLRDIHLPRAISWWPLAPGWWLAFVFALLVILLVALCLYKIFKPSLKKKAVKELMTIEKAFDIHGDAAFCLAELSLFLRRTVLCQQHTDQIAGLTGERWLNHLDQALGSTEFSCGAGQILLEAPYRLHAEKEDALQLMQLCRKWVNKL